MARLPPLRHPLHCGLRIPDLRGRDDSPLNRSGHQGVFPQFALREGYQPRGSAVAAERHVPNSIATMRPRLVAALATMLSRCPCCAARNRY